MYGDELCDFRIQMCWFVIISVLGGATRIRPLIGQGHPTGGTIRWLPPPSSIMLVSEVNTKLLQNVWWVLQRIYYCDIVNVKLLWSACMSITKDLLLCDNEY
jgi:hypothetical protein